MNKLIKGDKVYYRSEGFPLTGIFHPWAQWDMGLDTLGNSSPTAAALGGRDLQKIYNFLRLSLKWNCMWK